MSTRSTTHFSDGDSTPIVYKHYDGYPDGESGMVAVIERFYDWIEGHWPNDTRYNDNSYLAARFVRYLTELFDNHKMLDGTIIPWNGLGVGIVTEDPGDIEYRYVLHCTNGGGRPRIEVRQA